jgi:periplasmic copper chaperone A
MACASLKDSDMTLHKLAGLALFTCLAPAAWAQSAITVTDARAFETAPTAMAGGGFLTITNAGSDDDVLLAILADFPRVELHTTEFEDDVARMIHVESVPVPAGETVTLEPGGLHVMFMGLQGNPLTEGGTISATLVFEQAGEVPVTFEVVKRELAGHHGLGHNH